MVERSFRFFTVGLFEFSSSLGDDNGVEYDHSMTWFAMEVQQRPGNIYYSSTTIQ